MKLLLSLVLVAFSVSAFATNDDIAYAVANDNVGWVKQLIESGQVSKDEVVPWEVYQEGTPIITIAAVNGSINVAKYLISLKADLNAKTPFNETALMLACYFSASVWGGSGFANHDAIAHALIDAGADLENVGGWSPVTYAAYVGRLDIIKYLLEKGAKVDSDVYQGVARHNTGLLMATRNGFANVVRYLLQHDADPRIVNSKGYDAAWFAENYGQSHIMPMIQCALGLQPGQRYIDYCKM